ncbi:Ppx/GppA family phosphatase [Hephaestia sp. GCM10023244]|uniref:Ppx/GppA family phosphatase n=1 Tax=unclassified Hephaestia TaxID=2631281 RepID=UPI0020778A06|nr:Ppx/GppA family phosphatase [Hephaestia sp. MAHUQ-44]MCM8731391.1 Ppx/GppA family phosphatase [Hephaestia sp. MAHUQ-44]
MANLLSRRTAAELDGPPRVAIIDIGSNSIRLVVYQGPPRLPSVLFNEKVMAGLGRELADKGTIGPDAMARARAALARFVAVVRAMEVSRLTTVATAAVREADNGHELIAHAEDLGLDVTLLAGEEEARISGQGVLSGIPDADGIVGDLGGGSLELVRVSGGELCDRASFPLGVLRLAAIRERGDHTLERYVGKMLRKAGWAGVGEGRPLYLVGGSWRALARLDMHTTNYALPILHQYAMSAETVARLGRMIPRLEKSWLRDVPELSNARIATLGDSAALLATLLRSLGSDTMVVSAFGLREGLLYGQLDPRQRTEDPLIVAAREEGRRLGRFAEHGNLLDRWIAPLFADETPALARLRHVACLLADVGWHANPEFRAERGLDAALHGNWAAIDARGRARVAQALFTSLGGGIVSPAPLPDLATADDLALAARWGLAIRLGQRFSAGVAGPLKQSRLSLTGEALVLDLPASNAAFYGEAVERRHKVLATQFGRKPVLTLR